MLKFHERYPCSRCFSNNDSNRHHMISRLKDSVCHPLNSHIFYTYIFVSYLLQQHCIYSIWGRKRSKYGVNVQPHFPASKFDNKWPMFKSGFTSVQIQTCHRHHNLELYPSEVPNNKQLIVHRVGLSWSIHTHSGTSGAPSVRRRGNRTWSEKRISTASQASPRYSLFIWIKLRSRYVVTRRQAD